MWERKEPKEENISQKGKEIESAIGADVGHEKEWNKGSPANNRNNRVHDQAGDVMWGWSVHVDQRIGRR